MPRTYVRIPGKKRFFFWEEPTFGAKAPTFGAKAPTFGGRAPTFGDRPPTFGASHLAFGAAPSFSEYLGRMTARRILLVLLCAADVGRAPNNLPLADVGHDPERAACAAAAWAQVQRSSGSGLPWYMQEANAAAAISSVVEEAGEEECGEDGEDGEEEGEEGEEEDGEEEDEDDGEEENVEEGEDDDYDGEDGGSGEEEGEEDGDVGSDSESDLRCVKRVRFH
jgi:hypothetical protein